MPSFAMMEDYPVAMLNVLRRNDALSEFEPVNEQIPIGVDDDFYIGRSSALCRYFFQKDRHVSNRHLRVHCILFDETATSRIPPLVYAEDCSTNGILLTADVPEADELSLEKATKVRSLRRKGPVLLNSGDRLQISPLVALQFQYRHSYRGSSANSFSYQQLREISLFRDRYSITNRILGQGGHGAVYVAIHKKSNRQLACKILDRDQFLEDSLRFNEVAPHTLSIFDNTHFREFDILKDLDQPNVIRLEKVFWSDHSLYIFQDLITGGDLFSYLQYKGGRLADVQAAVVLLQILKAVDYLHDHDIVHRDLKLENILMASLDDKTRVVLTDFETARRLPSDSQALTPLTRKRMSTYVGTAEYTAPEIHRLNPTIPPEEGYSKAVDLWSIGVIATTLLSGESIFGSFLDPTREAFEYQVVHAAAECDLSVLDYGVMWRHVGSRPKDLIRKLLVLDEKSRLTAKEALEHNWFTAQEYWAELDALYQETIKDWQPRRKVFRLVEKLDLDRLPRTKPVKTSKPVMPTNSKSPYFNSPQSSPRRILPMKRRIPARGVATPLPRIDEETAAEVLHASMPYQESASPNNRSQKLANDDEVSVEHDFSELNLEQQVEPDIEVEMTDREDSPEKCSQSFRAVSESPIQKRKLPFEEGDLTDDESPVRAGTRRKLQFTPNWPRYG